MGSSPYTDEGGLPRSSLCQHADRYHNVSGIVARYAVSHPAPGNTRAPRITRVVRAGIPIHRLPYVGCVRVYSAVWSGMMVRSPKATKSFLNTGLPSPGYSCWFGGPPPPTHASI